MLIDCSVLIGIANHQSVMMLIRQQNFVAYAVVVLCGAEASLKYFLISISVLG